MAHLFARTRSWATRKEKDLVAHGSCYRAYSFLFAPFALAVFAGLIASGREIIWNIDGLAQYYSFFVYEGQWLRRIVQGLLSGQGLQVPLWEWCCGYGADVPTTFDVFLDPLNLVSGVTPEPLSEWVFQLLVIVRLYLAGLAFAFYCKTRGEDKTGTVLAALLYALCGAGLTGVRWASGLHALMLFPVVLAGAERILAGRRPWVFVASLSALAIVSYYFTYMACILLVAYLALRVTMVERPRLTMARFLRWAAVFAGLVVLCLAIAGFALVPAAMALMGMDRLVDQATTVPLLYAPSYYLELVCGFLSTSEVGSDTYQGFGGFAFLACVLLFVNREKNRELRAVFLALTLGLMLPQVGSVLNVMNYASNRWAWGYDLCMALVLARTVPCMREIDMRTRTALLISSALYALVLVIPSCRTEANVAGFAALVVTLLVVLLSQGSPAWRALLTVALGFTLAVNGFYFLAADEGGKATQQVPLGMAYKKLTSSSADSVAASAFSQDDGWWRYDAAQTSKQAHAPMNRIPNNSLVLGLQGIDFYNSVYNDRIDAFHTELAIAGDDINFRFLNLQGRGDLMALLGVRYYAYRADGTDALPYGFALEDEAEKTDVMGIDYQLARSKVSLPLGATFDHAIMHEDYLSLTPLQRQQALLQAVVIDDAQTNARDKTPTSALDETKASHETTSANVGATMVSASSLEFEDASVPFQVLACDGVGVEDGRWVVAHAGAWLTLSFEGTPEASTYLGLTGLSYQPLRPSELMGPEELEGMQWYHRANLLLEDLSYVAPITYELAARSDVSPAAGFISNCVPSNHMYGGKDTWLVNLGYAKAPAHAVTISFDQPGAYMFDDLRVLTQTHERLFAWSESRGAAALKDTELRCNRLTGTIELDEPRTMLLTIAYHPGWSAFVDGQPATLLRADTGFMAIDLSAGYHAIELRYLTPGLVAGFSLTGAGIAALVVALVLRRRDHMPAPRQHDPASTVNGRQRTSTSPTKEEPHA